ncbi:cyclopropane-fatty-acyl-phospholipid synthase family protein [Aurantimonas sp. MSK8Z-1]|uniref:SAM-dependent methyltransferase n=1 Tax=Mangrovibrevibacter kandeliae TaxID=2968473 RepID=UPI002118058E|nr:cyclopropane-fatty-acyl-phospholipid synthase family protein [Aurantimonas sp. MSK8Z-1]MCW4114146.1 cyclopropane-fatty-acyl-phospholipid synthase family protein [Aurantimonas sp. MSK8Z-1]
MNALLKFYVTRLITKGTMIITDAAGQTTEFGDGGGEPVHIHIKTKSAERRIATNPALQFGERYMDGEVDLLKGSIYDVLALVFENAGNDAATESWMRAIERLRLLYRRHIQNNTPIRARSNVQHHYDLSSELYDLFLDIDRQYSCAYFETPDATLDEAQLAKKRHIAAKLYMDRPALKTLDIGCGWGGLGLYLADHCEADVTGITLSDEQFKLANQRAADAGLADRATFKIEDYRKTEGPFDRIVSVGMFEHVGREFYRDFFRQAARLLDRNGVMVLHSIGRFGPPANTNAFIAKYIFPGGYIPSLSEVTPIIEESGLMMTDIEILRLHYAETLKNWRERFEARRDEAKAIYDERFCRMWEFYLAASETSFRWQDMMVFQIQLTKRNDVLPLTRDYMIEAEAKLREAEQRSPALELCHAAE